jgi:hypothetical protein
MPSAYAVFLGCHGDLSLQFANTVKAEETDESARRLEFQILFMKACLLLLLSLVPKLKTAQCGHWMPCQRISSTSL